MAITDADLEGVVQGTVDALLTHISKELAPLRARLADLEARPTLKYAGVFKDGTIYEVGNFCSWDGSLWHCKEAGQRGRPGVDPAGWTLCCKRGADGKDAAR